MAKIYLSLNKSEEKALRRKTEEFVFGSMGVKEVDEILRTMRAAMREANGVGLSANQIGLPYRIFVVEVPDTHGNTKQYAIFNPTLEKVGEEKEIMEEGCLSVPKTYGEVERAERLTLKGFDKRGKPLKIKAWGLLSRVFQHEVDHLEGKLFIDKAKNIVHAEQKSQ